MSSTTMNLGAMNPAELNGAALGAGKLKASITTSGAAMGPAAGTPSGGRAGQGAGPRSDAGAVPLTPNGAAPANAGSVKSGPKRAPNPGDLLKPAGGARRDGGSHASFKAAFSACNDKPK